MKKLPFPYGHDLLQKKVLKRQIDRRSRKFSNTHQLEQALVHLMYGWIVPLLIRRMSREQNLGL